MDEKSLKKILTEVRSTYFPEDSVFADENGVRPEWSSAGWYLETAARCLELLTDRPAEKAAPSAEENVSSAEENALSANDRVPSLEAQARALYMLKTQFLVNMAGRNKGALRGEDLEKYLNLAGRCLRRISPELISAEESMMASWRLLRMQWSAMIGLKYRWAEEFFIENGRLYCRDSRYPDDGPGNQSGGIRPAVLLELLEEDHGVLRLDCSLEKFPLAAGLLLEIRLNGKTLQYREVPRISGSAFFGVRAAERVAFSLEIPEEALHNGNAQDESKKRDVRLEFILREKGGQELLLPVTTVDYQSRISAYLKHSYWCFRKWMVTFQRNSSGEAEGIRICPAGRIKRMKRELALLKEILRAPYGSKQMFLVRCAYWLVWPFYSRRKIWITFDKLYKGGDCGEYFYKYMMTRKRADRNMTAGRKIKPVYVMRKDAADFKRLQEEGYHPSAFRSLQQRLDYLYADMVFATHSSVHGFCGFSKWEIRFLQDRLRSVNTCIQHGLSVQDLTADSHRVLNNNKRYYCASRCEIENLSRPAYDYPAEALRLTGIPRYDGLVNQDCRKILITPTWRSYIAMPSVMGDARPYHPEFKNTDYYKIFQALLENKKLSETAKRTGYQIVYLLHPVISAQKEDFRPGDGVEILSALEVNYEKILTQSSLMVTDYSGVQFDFAYMRKPLVYFHPPKLPPHYEDGGFSYEEQGFGEICQEPEELVETLCRYMEQGCRLTEFYRERQDAFFAYSDHENCRRIFEDALEYSEVRLTSASQ